MSRFPLSVISLLAEDMKEGNFQKIEDSMRLRQVKDRECRVMKIS